MQAKGATFDRYQLLTLYMAVGGIPFYLENWEILNGAPGVGMHLNKYAGITKLSPALKKHWRDWNNLGLSKSISLLGKTSEMHCTN